MDLDVVDRDAWTTFKRRARFVPRVVRTRPAAERLAKRRSTVFSEHPQASTAAILVLAAFAIRAWQFGNPLIYVDENFYLLVGDRMLHGMLPYVDIWDRKPIGLFLIYAAIRLLGGEGIIQYQVVATLFAAGTAFIVARISSRVTSQAGAIMAGIFYLFMLVPPGGIGGQAPVFYNLLMAGAALALVDVVFDKEVSRDRLMARGSIAMALVGLAMQIKYSVIFEGIAFGLLLLFRMRSHHKSLLSLAGDGAVWVILALLPTALAMLAYASLGHLDAFMQANFLSILARSSEPTSVLLGRLGAAWTILQLPFFALMLTLVLTPWRAFPQGNAAFGFAMAWLGSAVLGFLLFGTYFNHYMLPLMAPIAVACSPLFSCRQNHIGKAAAGFLFLVGPLMVFGVVKGNLAKKGGAPAMEEMVAAIRPRMEGCLYLYDGDVMLYHKLHSCLLTRYPFPTHLNLTREAGSIGIDPLAEIRRIFATHPHLVMDGVQANEAETENPAANALARGILARDYLPVAVFRHAKDVTTLYERRDDVLGQAKPAAARTLAAS